MTRLFEVRPQILSAVSGNRASCARRTGDGRAVKRVAQRVDNEVAASPEGLCATTIATLFFFDIADVVISLLFGVAQRTRPEDNRQVFSRFASADHRHGVINHDAHTLESTELRDLVCQRSEVDQIEDLQLSLHCGVHSNYTQAAKLTGVVAHSCFSADDSRCVDGATCVNDHIAAEQRKAQEAADKVRREAEAKEAARIAEEKRIADEAAAREADVKHRKAVGTEIVNALLESTSLNRVQAIEVLTALKDGLIPRTKINY